MNTVSLKLPDHLDNALARHANQQGLKKSQFMRKVLENHIARREKNKPSFLLDRISSQVGSISGPVDLSHNANYMKGYGE
jgi:hypothetical protein